MPQSNRVNLCFILLILFFIAGFLSLSLIKLYSSDAVKTDVKTESKEGEKNYVGWETCVGCHSNNEKSAVEGPHSPLFLKKSPGVNNGCEACHGGGSLHASNPPENILNFKKEIKEGEKACLRCHKSEKTANFQNSQHHKKGVSCTKCHNPHDTKTMLRNKQPSLCLTCHQNRIADMNLPSHHPIKEKKVVCVDCHNPHQNSKLNSQKLSDVCLNCHQEKAGPFAFEHRAVAESCTTCHTPHGSVNQNLLILRTPSLCLQCHSNAPSFHDLTSGIYKKCVSCHAAIHGSNSDAKLRKF